MLLKYFSDQEHQCCLLFNSNNKQLTFRFYGSKKDRKEAKIRTVKLQGLDFIQDDLIETAISNSLAAKDMLYLFSKKHVYTIDLVKLEVLHIDDWDVANLTLIDNHYLYSI